MVNSTTACEFRARRVDDRHAACGRRGHVDVHRPAAAAADEAQLFCAFEHPLRDRRHMRQENVRGLDKLRHFLRVADELSHLVVVRQRLVRPWNAVRGDRDVKW